MISTMRSKDPLQDSQWTTLCVVTTTVAHAADADDLARALVAARVAACMPTARVPVTMMSPAG